MIAVFVFLQWISVLMLAPLLIGCIRKLKARFQNRVGASVFQPYRALATLTRKEMTITRHSSWVFHVVPVVVLASSLVLAWLVPALGLAGRFFEASNTVFWIAGVLALGSLFLVLGGMDVASAFGGMGSSREMTLASLVEPAFILVLVTLGFLAGSWNVAEILTTLAAQPWYLVSPFLVITLLALALVILAENARYPVDNPATHLELTMVHEAMILEYSGAYLAVLEYAAALKLTVLAVFFMNILLPFGMLEAGIGLTGVVASMAWLLVKLFLASGLIALVESTVVKMRFYRMQEYMSTAYVLAFVGLALTLALR